MRSLFNLRIYIAWYRYVTPYHFSNYSISILLSAFLAIIQYQFFYLHFSLLCNCWHFQDCKLNSPNIWEVVKVHGSIGGHLETGLQGLDWVAAVHLAKAKDPDRSYVT